MLYHKSGDERGYDFRFRAMESREISAVFLHRNPLFGGIFIFGGKIMNKKAISILMSAVLFISLLMPFSAFAGIKDSELKKQVEDDIKDEISYLDTTPSLSQAVSSQMLFRVDQSKKHGFLTQLDVNLALNDGKIIVDGNENSLYYACVINILDLLGEDYTDYKGYNIKDLFVNCTETTVDNPYYVMQVVEACKTIGEDALAHTYIDTLIEDTYTMGQGMYYWGYSADNNGMFLATVGLYKDDYQEYINDAITLIENEKTDHGYDNGYGVSASTTSCVLLGYTIIGDEQKALEAYRLLVDNFENPDNNGIMQYDGVDDSYETSQALRSLSYFINLIESGDNQGSIQTPDDSKKEDVKIEETKNETKKDAALKSPQTGAGMGISVLGLGVAVLAVSRRKTNRK